jgi:hypothetical protein
MTKRICPECGKAAHSADTSPRPWECPSCGGSIPSPEGGAKLDAANTLEEMQLYCKKYVLTAARRNGKSIDFENVAKQIQALEIAIEELRKVK